MQWDERIAGAAIRAYLNGKFDEHKGKNPYVFDQGIFDAGASGADFTVGGVNRSGTMGNWYAGLLGGLAIYNRALSEGEMRQLAAGDLLK